MADRTRWPAFTDERVNVIDPQIICEETRQSSTRLEDLEMVCLIIPDAKTEEDRGCSNPLHSDEPSQKRSHTAPWV